jgi:oleandomycin transport system ATP-binding protein
MTMTDYPIQAEGLTKRYRSVTALDGVDLAVPSGTVLALLGPNGAGKTTVVRILATLLRPDGGSARVGGFDVVRQGRQARALIGLTGQFAAVDDALTGYENLLLIGRLLDLSRPQARVRATELLAGFGLAEAARRTVKTYSGGMRRRLDVAASLVGRPRVLFLDEPTTGLDPASRGEVWDRIRGLAADGTAVLLTTHYLDEADRLATEVVVLDHGKVIERGAPSELKATVGGQVLEARAADQAQSAAVADILGAVAGGPATARDDGLISVPVRRGTAGTDILAEAARRLGGAGIEVTELGVRLASLDEVFGMLTGAGTRAGAEPR